MTLRIGQLHSIIVCRTGYWLYVVLVSFCAPFTISLRKFQFIMIFIMTVLSNIEICMAILTFRTTPLGFLLLSSICPANAQLPGCFHTWTFALDIGMNMLPLDAFMFTISTRKFYRGVPGFATDGPCVILCRRFTTCLLYVSPLCGNLVENDSSFVHFCLFIPHPNALQCDDILFCLPCFHVSNCALFST